MTLDFDALRKKRGVTTSGTGEFDFDAYRNRKVTETPDVERVTVNPILKSTLSGVGIGEKPMEFPTYSRAVTPEPAPKKEEKAHSAKSWITSMHLRTVQRTPRHSAELTLWIACLRNSDLKHIVTS